VWFWYRDTEKHTDYPEVSERSESDIATSMEIWNERGTQILMYEMKYSIINYNRSASFRKTNAGVIKIHMWKSKCSNL
jgi:hypothetical protein